MNNTVSQPHSGKDTRNFSEKAHNFGNYKSNIYKSNI